MKILDPTNAKVANSVSYNSEALPVFQLVNDGVGFLKDTINNGQRGCSFSKGMAYLGYRIVSYSGIPTALNLASTVLALVFSILTLPLRCCDCGKDINNWCWKRTAGSFGFFLQSLYDITCDFRQLTGVCCCAPESFYRAI